MGTRDIRPPSTSAIATLLTVEAAFIFGLAMVLFWNAVVFEIRSGSLELVGLSIMAAFLIFPAWVIVRCVLTRRSVLRGRLSRRDALLMHAAMLVGFLWTVVSSSGLHDVMLLFGSHGGFGCSFGANHVHGFCDHTLPSFASGPGALALVIYDWPVKPR